MILQIRYRRTYIPANSRMMMESKDDQVRLLELLCLLEEVFLDFLEPLPTLGNTHRRTVRYNRYATKCRTC